VRFYGKGYMNHPDHRVAADVALDAVFPSAETRLIFPELLAEGLEPHHVKRVFIPWRPEARCLRRRLVHARRELAALREHKSQMGQWDPADMITAWAREQGKSRGLAAAEAYRLMVLESP